MTRDTRRSEWAHQWAVGAFLKLSDCGGERANQIVRSVAVVVRAIHLQREAGGWVSCDWWRAKLLLVVVVSIWWNLQWSFQVTGAERLQGNGELLPGGVQIVLHHLPTNHRHDPHHDKNTISILVTTLCVFVYLCPVDQLPLSIICFFKELQERIRLPKRVLKKKNTMWCNLNTQLVCLRPLCSQRCFFKDQNLGPSQNSQDVWTNLLVKVFSLQLQHNGSIVFDLFCCDLNKTHTTYVDVFAFKRELKKKKKEQERVCTYSYGSFSCRFVFLQLQRPGHSFTGDNLKTERIFPSLLL